MGRPGQQLLWEKGLVDRVRNFWLPLIMYEELGRDEKVSL